MTDAEPAALARDVEEELAPVLAQYSENEHSENGHLVYPASVQIATAWA